MKRVHDEAHLAAIRKLPCLVCNRLNESEAAHVRYGQLLYGKRHAGMAEKPDDRWTVPLCASCHRTSDDAQHRSNEERWWYRQGIDPLVIAALLYSHLSVGDELAANAVARNAEVITAGTAGTLE